MNSKLKQILMQISNQYKQHINQSSSVYLEVDIGNEAEKMGYSDLKKQFSKVYAMVPLKKPLSGMKVMIDGRTFKDYSQFDSGVVTPGYVARQTGLVSKPYTANESMVLNFN